ncbi:MAG: ECF transporter S component [Bacilli bacterium]|nr:ECF transporter S component [Bacilli bacterium]
MGNQNLQRITLNGVLIGLFLVFGLLRFRIGTFLEIGLGSLVIVLAAVALSPWEAVTIGLIGEFLNQILFSGYGLTPTTPLWILPPAIRGLIIGLVALAFARKGDHITKHKVIYFITVLGTALFISGLDTGLLYLDGLIMGYPVHYTWLQTGIRFLTSQVTAVLVAILVLPLHRAIAFLLPPAAKKNEEKGSE